MNDRTHNLLFITAVGLFSFMLLHFILDSKRLIEKIHYLTISLPVIYLFIYRNSFKFKKSYYYHNNFNYFIILLFIFLIVPSPHGIKQLLNSIEILIGLSLFSLGLFYLNSECRRGLNFILISFALVCTCFFFLASLQWFLAFSESNSYIRINLYGAAKNPVHASLLILFGISYLWLFIVEPHLSRLKAGIVLQMGWLIFSCICIYTSIIFNSRSTILAAILMLVFSWLSINRGRWFPAFIFIFLLSIYYIPIVDILAVRGTSYRLEIWSDALNQLYSKCNMLVGCGTVEKYRPAGFRHPHSAYLSTLFYYGLPVFISLLVFVFYLFRHGWKNSQRWFVLSIFGWASVLTTSGGVLVTPEPLWIYVWLPSFMVLITSKINFGSKIKQTPSRIS